MAADGRVAKVKDGLKQAYGLDGSEEIGRFYTDWAEEYEDELSDNGYVTPERCAKALAKFATDKSQPIMDLACGTGLSALALRDQGFTTIDGFDLSEGMLEKARAKTGLYRDLGLADMSQPLETAILRRVIID
ncbi:MAG: methyltransferase domain-containing protein [Pseudomonadota bacterium]